MDERQFQQAFTETLNEEIEIVNLWSQIQPKLPGAVERPLKRSVQLAKVATILLVIALTGVVAYAFYQSVVVPSDPGITSVEDAELLTYYNETQSLGGEYAAYHLTVTLDYAYADANRITVGYTVRGESPEGRRMMAYSNPSLTSATGAALDRIALIAVEEDQQAPTEDASGVFTSRLTTNFIPNEAELADGASLDLRLVVDVALSYLDAGAFPAPTMMMAGQAAFSFAVPFIAGTSVDTHQAVTENALTVELQRVVITPSMTRLEMCYQLALVELPPGWSPFVRVQVNDETIFAGQAETYGLTDTYDWNSQCRGVIIPEALSGRTGDWQVEIVEFNDLSGQGSMPVTGPWSFAFNVPEMNPSP